MTTSKGGHPNSQWELENSPARVREMFDYCPETGCLTAKCKSGNRGKGRLVGYLRKDGYLRASLNWRPVMVHRLVWCHVYGAWPKQFIDHINRDRSDNRIANLREASRSLNNSNTATPKTNTSGFQGVSWHKRIGAWHANISIGSKKKSLGYFEKPEAAHAEYLKAKSARDEMSRSA